MPWIRTLRPTSETFQIDRVHNDYVRTESQQLTNAKKLIQELEEKKCERDLEVKQLKEEVSF